MTSKSNSKAGATLDQVKGNATSIVVMQQRRCPNFDVFDAVFGSSPGVNPVYPTEVGAGGGQESDVDDSPSTQAPSLHTPSLLLHIAAGCRVEEESEAPVAHAAAPAALAAAPAAPAALAAAPAAPKSRVTQAAAPVAQAAAPAAPAAPAAAAAPAGKPAAAFHLAPCKKEKKMDLGEAYLKAQQSRIESQV